MHPTLKTFMIALIIVFICLSSFIVQLKQQTQIEELQLAIQDLEQVICVRD